MDYEKIRRFGDWLFALGGCGVVWTSIYRLGFGESLASMPRSAFIVATQFFSMGLIMILCGINLCHIAGLFNILKTLWGKAFYCLFVYGMMDVFLFNFSYLVDFIAFIVLGLVGFYVVTGLVFIFQEIREISDLRK